MKMRIGCFLLFCFFFAAGCGKETEIKTVTEIKEVPVEVRVEVPVQTPPLPPPPPQIIEVKEDELLLELGEENPSSRTIAKGEEFVALQLKATNYGFKRDVSVPPLAVSCKGELCGDISRLVLMSGEIALETKEGGEAVFSSLPVVPAKGIKTLTLRAVLKSVPAPLTATHKTARFGVKLSGVASVDTEGLPIESNAFYFERAKVLYRDQDGDIATRNLETGEVEKITNTPFLFKSSPVSSFQGDVIAFVAQGARCEQAYRIYLHTISDGSFRQITGLDGCAPSQQVSDGGQNFSPDGKRIVFSRSSFTIGEGGFISATGVYMMTIGEKKKKEKLVVENGSEPAFSPNGKIVYFLSSHLGNYGVHGIDLETKTIFKVSHDSMKMEIGFAVSSTGAIAVVQDDFSLPDSRRSIAVMNADGTGLREIVRAQPGDYFNGLAWDQSGTRIITQRFSHSSVSIVIIDTHGETAGQMREASGVPVFDRVSFFPF